MTKLTFSCQRQVVYNLMNHPVVHAHLGGRHDAVGAHDSVRVLLFDFAEEQRPHAAPGPAACSRVRSKTERRKEGNGESRMMTELTSKVVLPRNEHLDGEGFYWRGIGSLLFGRPCSATGMP